MKKFLTRVLALALVSLMFAMPCMAASFSSVTYEGDTITVSLDGYTMGDESTVIIVKKDVSLASVKDNEIVNIDQKPIVKDDGTVTFTLPVDERAQEIGVTHVDIYAGGSSLDEAFKYSQSIKLNEQDVTTIVRKASFKTSSTGEFDSYASAAEDIQVIETKYVNDQKVEEIDITSKCMLKNGNSVIEVYYGGVRIDSVPYTVADIKYRYEAYFKSGKTTFLSIEEAKADVAVKEIKVKDGVDTDEVRDVTAKADIKATNGVISVSILEYDGFSAVLNFTLATLGISGVVNSPELEMPLENALVYLYEGETFKSVVLTDAEGSYSFKVGAGTYKVIVSASYVDTYDFSTLQFVPVSADVTVTDGIASKNIDVVLPLYGDVNGDGVVDKYDVYKVKASYTK